MKKLNTIFILLLLVHKLFAQDVSFTANTSRTKVGMGEQFQISFTINANASNFKAPSFNDFDVYAGPNQSTSMQIVNGNMSQTVSISYIVAPKKEGKFTIGPASIISQGKKLETKPIVIEVTKGSTQGQQQAQGGGSQKQSAGADLGDEIFLKCSVDKRKVVLGEQIIATYKIYTRVTIVDNGLSKSPNFTGFWTEDVSSKARQVELYNETYEGVTYQVAEVKKTVLFPQRTGSLELDPMEMECIIRKRVAPRSNSVFDQFFGGGYQDQKIFIRTKPVKIEVLPLPEAGKPVNYKGAVGSFSIEGSINKTKLKTNESANLTYKISGKGNLKLLDPIEPLFPQDIESYQPKIIDNILATPNGISGNRTYDFLLIPRHGGTYNIDPIEFSYYDPQQAKYFTLTTPSFELSIEKSTESEGVVYSGAKKEDVKMIGSDIRFIKTGEVKFYNYGKLFWGSGKFYLTLSGLLFLFLAFVFLNHKKQLESSNVVLLKQKQANKIAGKRLVVAKQHIINKNDSSFYEEIFRALYGYLGDKLHIPVATLNKEAIISSLSSRGIEAATINLLITTLDKCEFARYAPLKNSHDMEHVYQDAIKVISQIEQELK